MNRSHAFLHLLLLIVALLVFIIVRPFLEYILLALILAYILHPVHVRFVGVLRKYLPRSTPAEPLSALTLIVGSFLVLVVPLLYIFTVFLEDFREISRGETDLQTELIEAKLGELAGVEITIDEAASQITELVVGAFVGDVSGLVSLLLHLSLGLALLLFLVFYLLLQGKSFVAWLFAASPLSPEMSTTLIEQVDRTTWGAVIGHAFAAVVQALVAGVGLYAVGIPNVVFWTIVMMILAFLPLIGVFMVWAPAAGYLYLVDQTTAAVFLALYGIFVVSFIDYYVRPIMIDSRAQLNPAVILAGVFGGVYTLGFVGLFVGPILIGVLVAILETFRETYPSGDQAALFETEESQQTDPNVEQTAYDEDADDTPRTA